MSIIELAKKCGATTPTINGTEFQDAQLQAFYDAAKQEGRDELQMEMSLMEPDAYIDFGQVEEDALLFPTLYLVHVAHKSNVANYRAVIILPQPPKTNEEGESK